MKNIESTNQLTPVAQPSSVVPAPRGYRSSPYDFEHVDDDDSDGGIIEYWRIICRNKRVILFTAFLGLIIGFSIGVPMKPSYRAKTSLEVLFINDDFMNMKQANPTTTIDSSFDTSEEQTQAKLLQSNALLNRVMAKLDSSAPGASQTRRISSTGWRSWLHLPDPIPATDREKLLAKAAGSLKVRATPRTRVLEVTVDSTEPQLAVDFANTLTQEFTIQSTEARWKSTQQTGAWLRRELDDARAKLRSSEDALQAYARSSGLIFTDETTNVATEKLQQVQQNLSTATADRIAKQSRYELAQSAPPESLGDVLSDPSLRDTQTKINDLKRQRADLSAVYSPEFSKVRRLQAELDALLLVYDQQRTDILNRIKNDYTEAGRKEKLLTTAYEMQEQNVTGQDEKAIQYNILKRDVDSNRQLYDAMLQQMKQSSIASAMRSSNVRVVDPAELPTYPVSPNFELNSAIGMITGLFLSVAVVTIRDRADRTLQQPGDVKLWTDLQELGVIPASSVDTHRPLYYHSKRSFGPGEKESLKISTNKLSLDMFTGQNSPSLIAESFRSALTSILFISENGSRPKVLVFTSANAADGKTTVASNLALAAAEIRLKVLIIDADLRRPRMHQLFNVDNETGLTDFLQDRSTVSVMSDFIRQTSIVGLDVVPAGPATNAAAHLLYSPRFAELLSEARQLYDMILIDTPPMLQMTDARVVGRLADAVVLVARSGRTTRDALVAAKERFAEDRIHVLGSILNDWNPMKAQGGYYGYGRYSYRYTQD